MTESKHFLFDGVWIEIPIWTEYLARDKDGSIMAYSLLPTYDATAGWYLPAKGDSKVMTITEGVRPICVKVE